MSRIAAPAVALDDDVDRPTGGPTGDSGTDLRAARRADEKFALPFEQIAARLKGLTLPEVDVVYGIASGGVVPASLVAYQLGKPLELIVINYRREDNSPQRPAPEILAPSQRPAPGARVLLVDDVSVTGQTIRLARETVLAGCAVTTVVMKGRADIVAFPEVGTCVAWPWTVAGTQAGSD